MERVIMQGVERRDRSWRDDLPVAATAGAGAGLAWAAARLSGVDLAVRTGAGIQQVGLVSVLVTAIVVTMAAGGLLRLLERRTDTALRTWTTIASVVLALSFVGPLGAVSVGAGLVLVGLHLVVGAVVVVGFRRARRGRVA